MVGQENPPIGRKNKLSRTFSNAQNDNLGAIILLASYIRTALGPRGALKMLAKKTDFVRPVMVSKDGYEILNRMDVAHPAAKILVDASKGVSTSVGDGSISAVILAAALIENARDLIRKGIHPTAIVDGYEKAEEQALEIMRVLAERLDLERKSDLINLVRSTLGTKLPEDETDFLAPLVVEAASMVKEQTHLGLSMDPEQVSLVKKTGGDVFDSELIRGIALYREPTSGTMPRDVSKAKIAFIKETLKIRKLVFNTEIGINSPQQLGSFREEERNLLLNKVLLLLKNTGANVIISEETFDDYVQITLGRLDIMAIRRAMKTDMEKLARATGGTIVPEVEKLTPADLGYAERIFVRRLERENWLFVEGCQNPKSVTILLRGSSSNVVESSGRAVLSALKSIDRVMRENLVFPGGASLEAELSHRIRKWALTLSGRQQIAAGKFADALEVLPWTLAESCGLNPRDSILEIRSEHAKGKMWFGVDVKKRRLDDMKGKGIYDIFAVKSRVLDAATEVAALAIRIDNVLTRPKWNPPRIPEGPAAHRVSPVQRVPGFEYGEAKKFLPETW